MPRLPLGIIYAFLPDALGEYTFALSEFGRCSAQDLWSAGGVRQLKGSSNLEVFDPERLTSSLKVPFAVSYLEHTLLCGLPHPSSTREDPVAIEFHERSEYFS